MRTLLQDLRYGARMLWKSPGFTLVAVITLAIGIGANTAIFSVIDALMLRPLPFREPDKLFQVWESNVKLGQNQGDASYPNFVDWRDRNQVFEQIAIYSDSTFNLAGAAEPERTEGAIVSPAFFPLLGVKPMLGRVFLPEEDHPNKVFSVVMSERLWRRRFNSDPQIIGRTISLDTESFTVVGVVPNISDLAGLPNDTDVWIPISHGYGFDNRRGHGYLVMARLKPGVTREQAQAEMDRIAGALAMQYPDSNTDRGVRLVPLQEQIVGDFKLALLALLGAVLFVLLIASANVANMLLARAAGRQKEISIRAALGAGRLRLIRQLIAESLVLAGLGGAAGSLLAVWGVYLLVAFGPAELPRAGEVAVDMRALGFTFAVSLLTGIIFGLAPALQASRPDLNETLKEGVRGATGGAGHRRVRSLLVVSEIALSLALLVGAGLLMRSFLKLQAVAPGFNPNNMLTMRVSLEGRNYEKAESRIAFYNQLLDRIKALPGVQSVGARYHIPLVPADNYANLAFAIEGRLSDPANRPTAYYNTVSPDLFRTMEIPVSKGRPFNEHDDLKAQKVIIINETLARRYFPGEDPIGKRMTLNDENPKEEDWATIVGVVKDTKPLALEGKPAPEMYLPFAQRPARSMALMIRTTNKPEGVAAAVRRNVLALDRNQLAYGLRTFEGVMSEAVATPRFRASLLGVFAAVALILAMVGVYGVMSYAVTQRTREIGIRMALGAEPRDALKMVLRQGAKLAAAGVAIGSVAAAALTWLIEGLLFDLRAADPVTFATAPLLLAGAALLACYLPARRATKVDPMVALRCE
ncbi:MAG TPA: ABC transporter permease [Blastocatellia bacterium]|jgi:putative ABC transport system permease protein|nr:ABC transporter permease [Blastocatellia bacterium]